LKHRPTSRQAAPAPANCSDSAGNLSRRQALVIGVGALGAAAGGLEAGILASPARAAEEIESHGMSGFGDLKYPADFKHFDYVNPNAPKGGTFSYLGGVRNFNQNFLTFNTLNVLILRGDGALGMDLTFASLMGPSILFAPTHDEPDAIYGLAARAVRISADGLTYRFLMRPEARFHDGSRLTAHDVAFTLNLLKDKGHPLITQHLRDLLGAEAPDEATVVARFAPKRGRDVPLFAAQLPILSRTYYEKKVFDETTLEIPLGSGPYRVGRFEAGRFIEYNRVADWWGASLPLSIGRNNFDTVRFEFYRDRDVAYEGFTGKNYLFREEFTSRIWATRYDAPAVKDGRIKRDVIPDETPSGAQGWFFNMRHAQFKDKRVREAFINAFDFEWSNKNLMYGSYQRTHSMFQNSPMMAVGKPGTDELALLEPFRDKVPAEVFGEPFVPPVSDGSGTDRALLRRGAALLQEAGYVIKDGKRVGPDGQRITAEFLIDEPTSQPIHLPFIKNLATLGIEATLRIVDPVQYQARIDQFDFDLVVRRFSFSSTPGDDLRPYFTSEAATIKGSQNLSGMADPVIDALVETIIAAENRPALVAACKALDRVVRSGRYWIPHYYKASHWLAFWDVFGRPATKPRYGRGIPETWWYDRDKAAKIERAG
jgi:microcin C transport system substrate-binding protein